MTHLSHGNTLLQHENLNRGQHPRRVSRPCAGAGSCAPKPAKLQGVSGCQLTLVVKKLIIRISHSAGIVLDAGVPVQR